MLRLVSLLTLAALCIVSTGCAMCCAPYDYDYANFGGRWERYDMRHGRAGSAFAPAADPVHEGAVVSSEIHPAGDGTQIIEESSDPYYERIESPAPATLQESGLEGYADDIPGE